MAAPAKAPRKNDRAPAPAAPEGMVVRSMVVRAMDPEKRTIEVVASSDALDAHGTILVQDWEEDGGLDRFRANPVILWAHNMMADELPIGRGVNPRVEEGCLRVGIEFAPEAINPRAEQCWQAYKQGFLRAVSVGFLPRSYRWEERDGRDVLVLFKNQLLELSAVPVGSNPDALAARSLTDFRARALAARQSPPPPPEADMTEDEKKLLEAALAATGAQDPAEALAGLRAMTVHERRAKALEAENATLRQQAQDAARAVEKAERDGLLLAAKKAGKITPADDADADFQATVRELTLPQLRVFLGKLQATRTAPAKPAKDPAALHEQGKRERAIPATVDLTPEEVEAAGIQGVSLDKMREAKAKRLARKAAAPTTPAPSDETEAEDED